MNINALIEKGYRPVALLALYDANLLIRPTQAQDKNAGRTDYPETIGLFCLNGETVSELAESFGMEARPLTIPGKQGKYGGLRSPHFHTFHLVEKNLEEQGHSANTVHLLYALEQDYGVLKLAAFHEDGEWRQSSYRGRYDLQWDLGENQEGGK